MARLPRLQREGARIARVLAREAKRTRLALDDLRTRRQLSGAAGARTLRVDGRRVVGREVHTGALEHQDRLRRAVLGALEDAGVVHFAVPREAWAPVSFGVLARERDQIVRALLAMPVAPSVRAAATDRDAPGRVGAIRGLDHVADAGDVVRLVDFAYHRATNQTYGSALGVNLEFWREDDDGSWLAPRGNRYGTRVPAEAQRAASFTVAGREYTTLEPFALPHIEDVTFPIDVVYTWVDGTDARWQRARAEALHVEDPAQFTEQAASDARFQQHDELRYSMRSLERHAPWVRHVWVVTAGQVPEWLNTADPRVTVVDHRDIWSPEGTLPTFNSHAIEAHLHRIDGLSEHFLYLNDDVFFGHDVTPSTFFHPNGMSKLFFSRAQIALGAPQPDEIASDSAGKNARRLVAEACGRTLSQKFFHTPLPLRRSVSYEIAERFPDEVRTTAQSVFRRSSDVTLSGALHLYYAYATGRAAPGRIAYRYVGIASPGAEREYQRLMTSRLQTFCLNDTTAEDVDPIQVDQAMRRFLQDYFPEPSLFEERA